MSLYLKTQIERNIEEKIGMVVLDDSLSRSSYDLKRELLLELVKSGVEQIILLEHPSRARGAGL